MKINKKLTISVLTVAVQSTLMMQAAEAAKNTIDIGGVGVTHQSAKFGEYNGLNESNFNGGFDLNGGDSFDSATGIKSWEITGTDIGTTSRSFKGSMSEQGKWKLNIGRDELRHNISDSYQTPLVGTMGSNIFTLPGNFGTTNAAFPTVYTGTGTRTLTNTQTNAFHTEKVGTSRYNTNFGAGYDFSEQLKLNFGYNHLEQTGAKLLAAASQGGQATPTVLVDTWNKESISIIMNPTKYKTDTFDLALSWMGEKAHLTASYFGSVFRDGFNSVSWENNITSGANGACLPAYSSCGYQNGAMSTAPNNDFHQLSLIGGYDFPANTKLVGGLSYGRNTQKDGFATNVGVMNTGTSTRTNLDGKVINTHGDLKLTNQSVHDLTLTAGLKYDQRKNNTASDTYSYWNLNSVSTPADNYIGINTPYSNRAIQEELAADYRITSSQKIRLAFDHENVKRWCENVASGLQCVSSPKSKEDKIGVNYKLKAFEDFTFKTDYSYAIRKGEFDHNFNSNIGTKYVVGGSPGTRTTINGGDLYGFVAFPYEGRKEHLVKASVNWQPTEKLDLGLSANYKKDNYTADLGVRNANSKGANLDTTYNFSDATSMSLYVDWQNGYRDMYEGNTSTTTGLKSDGSNTVAPSIVWSNRLKEDSRAIGLVGNHKGLMGGKMDIAGDLSYALDKSTYSTAVPYAVSLTLLCSNPTLLSCGSLPDIKSSLVTVKLSDSYQLDKNSKVALGYTYQHRIVQDYLYNIYQAGYTPATLMPTNEQAPSYNVSMLTVSYSYTF